MKSLILILFFISSTVSCVQKSNEELTVQDIEIFEGTIAWDLVRAIDDNNVSKIQKLLQQDLELVNFQEPVFGTTVLMWSISSERYQSARELLRNGADPNVISKTGTTALFRAISFSWDDTQAEEDPKFVKLLLDNGADPNINYCSPKVEGETDPIECGTSPLMYAISRGFKKVKLLVDAGASVDYKTGTGKSASTEALLMQDVNSAYFLIVEKKADVTKPYYFYNLLNDTIIETAKPHYPVDLLLDWTFDINSSEYKKKREIIEEFYRQGIDYKSRKRNISNLVRRRIQKMYPGNWKDYIQQY